MKKQILILWLGALLLTFLFGYLKSVTSSTYPVTGTINTDGEKTTYKFDKEYSGREDLEIFIRTDKDTLNAFLLWRKIGLNDFDTIKMSFDNGIASAKIPRQKPFEKIEYQVAVETEEGWKLLPAGKSVELIFYGDVPSVAEGLYYLTFVFSLLLIFRTGLEYFNPNDHLKKLSLFTLISVSLFGFFLYPFKKSFESGPIGTKVLQPGEIFSLFDLLLPVIWIAAVILIFKNKSPKITALFAAIASIILILFFI